jgi:hypothetical protein
MYIKQKRGNFKLKKCVYIQFFLPFRLFLPLVSFLGAKLNYLRASPDVQNMPEYVCFSYAKLRKKWKNGLFYPFFYPI